MAFLKIIFPVDGMDVLINGKRRGKTNVAFEIDSIAPPPGCNPADCEVVLNTTDTGPLSPREVIFAKV